MFRKRTRKTAAAVPEPNPPIADAPPAAPAMPPIRAFKRPPLQAAAPHRPELPRGMAPGAARAPAEPAPRAAAAVAQPQSQPQPASAAGRTLVVGREIRLSGKIHACEKLIVEGDLEADLRETRVLQIAASGRVSGSVEVAECEVRGRFEGEMTVTGLLTVRAGGHVGGTVRYGEIEVERGGRITGRAELHGVHELRPAARAADQSAAEPGPAAASPEPIKGPGLRPA